MHKQVLILTVLLCIGCSAPPDSQLDTQGNLLDVRLLTEIHTPGFLVATRHAGDTFRLVKYDLETGVETELTNSRFRSGEPAISPDGRFIAYSSHILSSGNRGDLWVMDAEGRNKKNLTGSGSGADSWPVWSSDSMNIAFRAYRPWGEAGSVHMVNRDGSRERLLYKRKEYTCFPRGFCDSDSSVIFSSGLRFVGEDYFIKKVNIYTGDVQQIAQMPGEEITNQFQAEISSDHKYLYFSIGRGSSIYSVDISNGVMKKISDEGTCVRSIKHGIMVYEIATSNKTRQLNLIDPVNNELVPLLEFSSDMYGQWSLYLHDPAKQLPMKAASHNANQK